MDLVERSRAARPARGGGLLHVPAAVRTSRARRRSGSGGSRRRTGDGAAVGTGTAVGGMRPWAPRAAGRSRESTSPSAVGGRRRPVPVPPSRRAARRGRRGRRRRRRAPAQIGARERPGAGRGRLGAARGTETGIAGAAGAGAPAADRGHRSRVVGRARRHRRGADRRLEGRREPARRTAGLERRHQGHGRREWQVDRLAGEEEPQRVAPSRRPSRSGSRARARAPSSRSPRTTDRSPGASARGGSGAIVNRFIAIRKGSESWNGKMLETIRYSVDAERVDVRPAIDRAARQLLGGDVGGRAQDGPRPRVGRRLCSDFAMPKSMTNGRRSSSMRMFSGFMSRWMIAAPVAVVERVENEAASFGRFDLGRRRRPLPELASQRRPARRAAS